MTTEEDKAVLRKQYLEKRKNLGQVERESAERQVLQTLTALPEYQNAKVVLAYVSVRGEMDTQGLLQRAQQDHKTIGLPRVEGKQMSFRKVTDLTKLTEGSFHIPEPSQDAPIVLPEQYAPQEILFVIPGSVFDRNGGRIGYGGGFYDRYFEKYPNLIRTAPVFELQFANRVPMNEFDQKMDLIISEKGIYRFERTE